MPKVVDRDRYRKELLGKSFELFARIGYGKITMRQLAREMNVSTGTLYHYFPSKEVMFLELVEELAQRDIGEFFAVAEAAPVELGDRVRKIANFVGDRREYFIKQMLISLDYYQQQGVDLAAADSLFARIERETIDIINNYLSIANKEIAGFIVTFLNGLILNEIFHSIAIDWNIQVYLLVKAVVSLTKKE
jgi:AcrR family transcriptional regulator